MQIYANELWRHKSLDGSRPIRSIDTITFDLSKVMWWWNCSRPIRSLPKCYHWAIIGDYTDYTDYKCTTNQNAPFQISTNQKLTQNLPFLRIENCTHTTTIYRTLTYQLLITNFVLRVILPSPSCINEMASSWTSFLNSASKTVYVFFLLSLCSSNIQLIYYSNFNTWAEQLDCRSITRPLHLCLWHHWTVRDFATGPLTRG